MGKTVYAHQIMNDPEIPNTIVRTSTLPEELGRITYLLSDKTGTLTQNGTLAFIFFFFQQGTIIMCDRDGNAKTAYGYDVIRCRLDG